jgi:RNA polymerase sigma factor (sigma-70 family)
MGAMGTEVPVDIAAALPLERMRLVRLCMCLSGSADVAEDLAQETLAEGWHHAHKLRSPEGLTSWLSAIARNVCRRWRQRQRREAVYRAQYDGDDPRDHAATCLIDADDLTLALERDELAALLDQALALLPAQTRQALVQHYVEGRPQVEIAARLGLQEGAVAVRLHRGKAALRRILQQDLRAEAATYGLGNWDAEDAPVTHIWCPFCGHQRLRAHIDRSCGIVAFRCPTCSSEPGTNVVYTRQPDLLYGVRSHKAILSRQLGALHRTLSDALRTGVAPCVACGRSVRVWRVAPHANGQAGGARAGIYALCERCHPALPPFPWVSRGASALRLPETQRFWRLHPRMHILPERPLAYAGAPAVLTRYQSLPGPAALDIISGRNTFDILAVHASAPV